eukprot:CAMPEP_0194781504 /NCGR_PEP_ID=MMETSP0323_2-20130528/76479_1 /TAXON_ID=2866 ORGANISM="Crypthecodinium cohnii, Strain Seligo" /NCGR_SAMPLE_ID=MMETSP0323_2 /ASSEMBLY_ACC=CAM_ASM_000346 /LENGTH=70 /DNA_ID=CAMNT_0039719939 /DNA_START=300 /DNA_END=512 /DNA_ORIENTATION=+
MTDPSKPMSDLDWEWDLNFSSTSCKFSSYKARSGLEAATPSASKIATAFFRSSRASGARPCWNKTVAKLL